MIEIDMWELCSGIVVCVERKMLGNTHVMIYIYIVWMLWHYDNPVVDRW
jgi:hypothetical protein